jgi:nucleoside-diphosphate-sugar epimerase
MESPPNNVFNKNDTLVHFAAHGVDPSHNSWDGCFDVNVRQSLNLWRNACKAGVKRIIVCGSCSEYGTSGEQYEFIPVEAPLMPVDPYGTTKAMATIAAMGLARTEKIELAVLRVFHTYGEGEMEHRFWPNLKAAAEKGIDFPMTSGEQIRDFCPVSDVAETFWDAALACPLTPGQPVIHNVGTGHPMTLLAFAEEWWQKLEAKGKLLPGTIPYRKNEVMRYVPAVEKELTSCK